MDKEEILSRCRVEYSLYPSFDHPDYLFKNPCAENFCDCEGECSDCPNGEFFAKATEALNLIGRRGIAELLRQSAVRMDEIADRHGDEIERS